MTATEIMQAIQTGLSGSLLVMVDRLWRAYDKKNDQVYALLVAAEAERRVLAEQSGLDTKRFKSLASKKAEQIRTEKEA
jgi:hypothetical protein